jgi:hypothetical protein
LGFFGLIEKEREKRNIWFRIDEEIKA